MSSEKKTIEQTFLDVQSAMNKLLERVQTQQNLINVQAETIRILKAKVVSLEAIAKVMNRE